MGVVVIDYTRLNTITSGTISGEWVVIDDSPIRRKNEIVYPVVCSCGKLSFKTSHSLKTGGCCRQCFNKKTAERNKANATHGMSNTTLFKRWDTMRRRCLDPKKNYFLLGIKVCKEWEESFETFRDWALSNGYDESLTIDRINPLGDYEPTNCRFVDSITQQYNKLHNLKLPNGGNARQVARANGITDSAFDKRLSKGWSLEKACTHPLRVNVDGKYITDTK